MCLLKQGSCILGLPHTRCVAKDGLELLTNLPPLSECWWDRRRTPSCLVFSVLEIYPGPCACYLSTAEYIPREDQRRGNTKNLEALLRRPIQTSCPFVEEKTDNDSQRSFWEAGRWGKTLEQRRKKKPLDALSKNRSEVLLACDNLNTLTLYFSEACI